MRASPERGFALVITLVMVALAAVVAVSLLTNATMDRTTARSYNDRYQAELAVQNGLEAAKNKLVATPDAATAVTGDDTFLVLRADGTRTNSSGVKDSYYFLAKAGSGPKPEVACYPLFSGGAASVLTIDSVNSPPISPPAAPATLPNPAEEKFGSTIRRYPTVLSFQEPPSTQWQEIPNPSDPAIAAPYALPYQRYTFWIEDLAGYVDAGAAGNIKAAGSHERKSGTTPGELSLFTIFDPAQPEDSGTTPAKALVENRGLLFTVPSLKRIAPPPSGAPDLTERNLAVRLGVDTGGERNLIPFGFSFKDEGTARLNINSLIADAAKSVDQKVTAIAKLIDDNLPSFASTRKGGLAGTENYSKTLAANMLDYADGDVDASVGAGYRGIDAYPFVEQFYERFIWQKNASETTNYYQKNGTWWADVKATGFVQLWNPTNKEITSGVLVFTDINRYTAWVGSNPTPFEHDSGTVNFSAANSLKPNEHKAFKIYDRVYNFDSGLSVRPTGSIKLAKDSSPSSDPVDAGYMVQWNGVTVDRAGAGAFDGDGKYPTLKYSGVDRTSITPTTPNSAPNPSWRGTLPALRYESTSEATYNLGDPRAAYYIDKQQAASKYAKSATDASDTDGNSAWWGRMYQKGLIEDSKKWFAAQTLAAIWPDGGHSTDKGQLPKDTTVDPMTLASGAASLETTKAPTSISNSGSYTSLSELGHVYDPMQWRPAGFPASGAATPTKPSSSADVAAVWRDAWRNDLVSDPNYGSSSTLRIGSPEWKTFDTDKSRAARLLDLLTTSDRTETTGLININTASRDALRSLGAGIRLQADAAMTPASVFGPVTDPAARVEADKYADAVIANRPFLSTSQLSGLYTDTADPTGSKFFGNSSQWESGGPTEWNDSAREEYFARMLNLTAVRSRNFRVFVTGQAVDPRIKDAAGNPRVISTVSRVFQVFLRPDRDKAGKITAQRVDVTYEKEL